MAAALEVGGGGEAGEALRDTAYFNAQFTIKLTLHLDGK